MNVCICNALDVIQNDSSCFETDNDHLQMFMSRNNFYEICVIIFNVKCK